MRPLLSYATCATGTLCPIERPWIFWAISTTLPATYFIELLRAIMLRGATFGEFWFHVAMLAGMGLALFTLCALRYQRRLT